MFALVNFCLSSRPPRDSRQRYASWGTKPHLNFVIPLVSIVSGSWETLSPALSARIHSTVYAKAALCPIHMPRHVSPFLCVLRPGRARSTASSFPPRIRLPQIPVPPSAAPARFCRVGTRRRSKFKRGHNGAISP